MFRCNKWMGRFKRKFCYRAVVVILRKVRAINASVVVAGWAQ